MMIFHIFIILFAPLLFVYYLLSIVWTYQLIFNLYTSAFIVNLSIPNLLLATQIEMVFKRIELVYFTHFEI